MSISLTLASPNVRELSNMTSFRVMPKHVYEDKDTVTEAEGRITCGPYVLESFNKEAGTITFAVNEYYPQKPNVEKIVYQLFGNEDTMYLALQQGDIDMVWAYSAGVAGTYQDVLSTDTNVSLVNVAAANAPAVLAFNNAKGLFSDENLRQAVSYALNYEEFKTYFGSAYAEIPNRGFVPSTTVGYTDTEKLTTDTAKADEYMKAAGYTEKNADGFYVNADGAAAAFTLTVNAAKETHVGYAEMIKTQLEAFGIQVNLDAWTRMPTMPKPATSSPRTISPWKRRSMAIPPPAWAWATALAPSMWPAITPCRAAARCSTKPFPPFWTN